MVLTRLEMEHGGELLRTYRAAIGAGDTVGRLAAVMELQSMCGICTANLLPAVPVPDKGGERC